MVIFQVVKFGGKIKRPLCKYAFAADLKVKLKEKH